MSLELHPNDTSREAKPGLFIFSGRWVVLLPVGVLIFIIIFKTLISLTVDWYIAAPIALLPMLTATIFVLCLVNGKPPSYASDLWLLCLWRTKSWLYMAGTVDKPPLLWIEASKPKHPKEF